MSDKLKYAILYSNILGIKIIVYYLLYKVAFFKEFYSKLFIGSRLKKWFIIITEIACMHCKNSLSEGN